MARKINIDTLRYYNELIRMNIDTLEKFQADEKRLETQLKIRSFIVEYCYKLMKIADGDDPRGYL